MNSLEIESRDAIKIMIKYCVDPSNTKYLEEIDYIQVNELLPFLVRLWKKSQDNYFEIKNSKYKQDIFKKIIKCNKTNNICFYLNADFASIYDDVIRTLSIRLNIFNIFIFH